MRRAHGRPVPASRFNSVSMHGNGSRRFSGSFQHSAWKSLFCIFPNGIFYWIGPDGSLQGGPYQYTYTVNSPTQATIVETFPSGLYLNGTTYSVQLTFSTYGSGSVSAQSTDYAGSYSGVFQLSPFSSPAPLANMSSRGNLAAGQSQIAGFVVSGTIPRTVLVRAIGPTLSQFGVSGPVGHTTLTVLSGTTVVAANTGWSSGSAAATNQLSQVFSAVGAFSLPAGSADSAVLVTLKPGVYSAVTQGVSASDAGAILVEAYFVH